MKKRPFSSRYTIVLIQYYYYINNSCVTCSVPQNFCAALALVENLQLFMPQILTLKACTKENKTTFLYLEIDSSF